MKQNYLYHKVPGELQHAR